MSRVIYVVFLLFSLLKGVCAINKNFKDRFMYIGVFMYLFQTAFTYVLSSHWAINSCKFERRNLKFEIAR